MARRAATAIAIEGRRRPSRQEVKRAFPSATMPAEALTTRTASRSRPSRVGPSDASEIARRGSIHVEPERNSGAHAPERLVKVVARAQAHGAEADFAERDVPARVDDRAGQRVDRAVAPRRHEDPHAGAKRGPNVCFPDFPRIRRDHRAREPPLDLTPDPVPETPRAAVPRGRVEEDESGGRLISAPGRAGARESPRRGRGEGRQEARARGGGPTPRRGAER